MDTSISAAVLLIGDELLSGSIRDENLPHIATTLEARGIRVRETRIVPDLEAEIVAAINELRHRYQYVFTTGGVGPTHDDITSDSIAKAFGVQNVVQQDVFDLIKGHLDTKGIEFTTAAQRMAYAPQGAQIMHSKQSIVPGYRMENVFVMAGVPRIMRLMLDAIVEQLNTGKPILSAAVHANVSEGEIAADLEKIQQQHMNVDIGSYPQDIGSTRTEYRVIFSVRGTEQEELDAVCNKILHACQARGIAAEIPS